MDDSDHALIKAIGGGDHLAFERLVHRYQNRVLNFIFSHTGDRHTAEDLAQEVFLRVYCASSDFELRGKVSTWIFKIAYNQALTEIDRRKKRRNLWQALYRSREEAPEELTVEPLERFEQTEEITALLGCLPVNQRAALLLRINENLSYREIADILEVSVQSVESLLFRARTNLKQALGKK
jgi:RNA polymerase sigma-70 factor, ECF subfamily